MRRLAAVLSMASMLALPALSRAASPPPRDKAAAAARVQAVVRFASAQCARLAKAGASFCFLDDTTELADVVCGVPLVMFEG